MKSKNLALLGCIYLLTALCAPVFAQDEMLDQAFARLEQRDYTGAGNLARTYLGSNPRRYRAEFIVAVADCSQQPNSGAAQQEIRALKQDYYLDGDAAREVDRWIANCPPAPVVAHGETSDGVGMSASAITSPPTFASAAPNKPNPTALRRMGPLVYTTSYSGDDYDERHGVPTPDECSRLCQLQAPCRSMTYATSSHICWLKRSVPPAQHGNGFVSAVKNMN
jgi:hypothetical protein